MPVHAVCVSEGGPGAVGGLSGYLKVEEKVGGSVVRDPTCICRESGDLYAEDTHIPVMTPGSSGRSSERWYMEREKCSSHL